MIFAFSNFSLQNKYLFKNFKYAAASIGLQSGVSKRKLVFATNSNIITPVSLQPNGVSLLYLKCTLFELTKFIV